MPDQPTAPITIQELEKSYEDFSGEIYNILSRSMKHDGTWLTWPDIIKTTVRGQDLFLNVWPKKA